jgi:hypothetical protein
MITHKHTNTHAHTHTQKLQVYIHYCITFDMWRGNEGGRKRESGGEDRGGTRRGREREGWMDERWREGGRERDGESEGKRERDREKCTYMFVQRSPLKSMLDVHACVNTYSYLLLHVCIYEV